MRSCRWKSSVSWEEVAKFSKASEHWWDPNGEFSLLHKMNPTRVRYVRDMIRPSDFTATPFKGLRFLDVGCGGGLLSESLARLGAKVLGIDASLENIGIAQTHAKTNPLLTDLYYECITAEELVERSGEKFDAVLSMEVIEHVQNPRAFVSNVCELVKPNGFVFLSTINKNIPSYVATILFAEYILGIVPKGTHDYSKYITPDELSGWIQENDAFVKDISGLLLNPFTKSWSVRKPSSLFCGKELEINYIMAAQMN